MRSPHTNYSINIREPRVFLPQISWCLTNTMPASQCGRMKRHFGTRCNVTQNYLHIQLVDTHFFSHRPISLNVSLSGLALGRSNMRLRNKRDVGPATGEQLIITHWPIGHPEMNPFQLNNSLHCFLIDRSRSLSTKLYGIYRPFTMGTLWVQALQHWLRQSAAPNQIMFS